MIISIINQTHAKIADEAVLAAIRAINRQIDYDFAPYWGTGATLRLESHAGPDPRRRTIPDMRGDAVIYLWDKVDAVAALGYHAATNAGVPYGFVFTELSRMLKEHWTTTLSHEVLELIGDPQVNLMVRGPHPRHPRQTVFHCHEMCDAVQAESYRIDGVDVANFVLPRYFTSGEERGGRNDFLGRSRNGAMLRSFGVRPGGYVSFYNPRTNAHEVFKLPNDAAAVRRIKLKSKAGATRRTLRHESALSKLAARK